MPQLIIYFPFNQANAGQLDVLYQYLPPDPQASLAGVSIDAVVLGYRNAQPVVNAGDLLVINAHGSDQITRIYSARSGGFVRDRDAVVGDLDGMGAATATAVYFAICYSALDNHIAHQWKANHGVQPVYGTDDVFEGSIARFSRNNVSGGIFTNRDRRLRAL
jgi:hypothetical protein